MDQCHASVMVVRQRGIRHPLFCTTDEFDYI